MRGMQDLAAHVVTGTKKLQYNKWGASSVSNRGSKHHSFFCTNNRTDRQLMTWNLVKCLCSDPNAKFRMTGRHSTPKSPFSLVVYTIPKDIDPVFSINIVCFLCPSDFVAASTKTLGMPQRRPIPKGGFRYSFTARSCCILSYP